MRVWNWNNLDEQQQQALLQRPIQQQGQARRDTVAEIIQAVRGDGDDAIRHFTKQFDGVELQTFQVSQTEIECAQQQISAEAEAAIQLGIRQIKAFHQAQLPQPVVVETTAGVRCERQSRSIAAVGLYVPGGTAPLPSTAMMLCVPAMLAKNPVTVLCTPPNKDGRIDPHILRVAALCGIDKVFKVGGAQAIAAMAFGTATIPSVDKIFGPGNAWVTEAKIQVAADADGAVYDMPAGPSEVLVIADASANPTLVAADLLSQAEHGLDSQVLLLATSNKLLGEVKYALQEQLNTLPRRRIAEASLAHSHLIEVKHVSQAITLSNRYAPEHLILHMDNAQDWLEHIQAAGTVFVGPWAPETLGDYVSGSNHVLPTYGYARSISGLSVQDFIKSITFQTVTAEGLKSLGPAAACLAEIEGLQAHARAVQYRLQSMEEEPCVTC